MKRSARDWPWWTVLLLAVLAVGAAYMAWAALLWLLFWIGT